MEKLKPPDGYETWLDYAIDTMDSRTLHLESCAGDGPWGRVIQGDEIRESARRELRELLEEIRSLNDYAKAR